MDNLDSREQLVELPEQTEPLVPASAPEMTGSANYGLELQAHELADRRADLRRKEYALLAEQVMLKQRKFYAALLFTLSLTWLCAIGVFLFLAGLGKLKVADSVLIALITTTTANVLGLFYIVARWLFPNRPDAVKDGKT